MLLASLLVRAGFAQTAAKPDPWTLGALLDGSGFVRIPAGVFMMGSKNGNADEQPVHQVRLRKGFEMGKFEVTQDQWVAVMHDPHAKPNTVAGEEPQDVNPSKFRGPSRPVDSVSWQAVQEFMKAMNVRDSKHVYRLPTEAEWEYAARAGSTEDRPKDGATVAWHEPNAGGTTHPVGQKAPNAWGLYDMLGNVQEWVQDWYTPDSYATSAAIDPQGAQGESYRVYRGCAWLSEPKYCRTAYRAFDFPNSGYYSVGFRLVRTPK